MKTVAAFDFDGTLTSIDSLFFFLLHSQGAFKTLTKLGKHLPSLALYGLNRMSNHNIKEIILTEFFKNADEEEMKALGKAFADQAIDRLIKTTGFKKLQWHKSMGHHTVLVSATLDIYTMPWGFRHGFDHIISTQLELTPEKKLTGKLLGKNCWGPEKTRRLIEHLEKEIGPRDSYLLYAYGDSTGDRDLLEIADFGFYRSF